MADTNADENAMGTAETAIGSTHANPVTKPLWMRVAPVLVIAAGIAAFFALDLDRYLNFESLKENREVMLAWSESNSGLAIVVFGLAYAAMVAFSLPGAVWATLIGGFIFGTAAASVYVVVSATIGATLIFLIARYALADFFHAKAGAAIKKMEAGFQDNAMSYMLVLRLVPLFPFWLVNLVPAFLGVPLRTYVLGTFFGIIPGSVVYCSVGNGLGAIFESGGTPDLGIIFTPEILGPIAGLALLSMVPIAYKRMKARNQTG